MLALLISLSLGSWGAEIPVDQPPATVLRAPNSSPWFATATSWDDSFLVAWQDMRFANVPVVMVARSSFDGGVEDPIGIVASNFNAARPALSARGLIAAIAWEHHDEGWLRLLRRDGQFISSPREFGGRCPAVAMGTTGGVFVSEDGRVRAVRFDTSGNPTDMTPIDLSTVSVPYGTCARVSIDDTGTTAMIMWRDENTQTVWSAVLPLMGPLSMPTTVGMGAGGGGVAVTSISAGRWFGVSAFTPAPPLVHLQGYDLSAAGSVQIPFLADNAWLSLEMDRCASGICFAATFDGPSITLQLGSFPLDGGAANVFRSQSVNGADFAFAATRSGQELALAATDFSSADLVMGNADFTTSTPMLELNNGQPSQFEPDVAVLDGVALVAWIEQEVGFGTTVVRAKRFDANGMPLDANAMTLVFPENGEALSEVEIMVGGDAWLVATSSWGSERSWLTRVRRDGTVEPQRRLGLRGMHCGFELSGEDVLVSSKQFQTMWWDPVMVTVSPDGGEVSTRMQDNGPKEHFTDVAITKNGERLVVWQDVDPDGMLEGIVAAKRIAEDGTVIDSTTLRLTPTSGGGGLEPQVVGDGRDGYFLVSRSSRQLWAQHVKGGIASSPKAILDTALTYEAPGNLHLVRSGDKAVVSFSDPSDGGVFARELSLATNGSLELTWLEPISDVAFTAFPAMAVSEDVVWATYARADTTTNNLRVQLRRWQRGSLGTSCSAGWMCLSNTCAAGSGCIDAPDAGAGTDAGTSVDDAGVIILPDGGAVLPDGGTPPQRGKWQLGIGASCSSGDASLLVVLSALLAWRGSRSTSRRKR